MEHVDEVRKSDVDGLKDAVESCGFVCRDTDSTSEWIGFSRYAAHPQRIWQQLVEEERRATSIEVGGGETMTISRSSLRAMKILVDISHEDIPQFIELLSQDYPEVAFDGKIARQSNMQNPHMPTIALYIAGSHRSYECLDFALSLGRKAKDRFGVPSKKFDMAHEVVEGSGIWVTQGNYGYKQAAKKSGKFKEVYSDDGVFFKDPENDFETNETRRVAQLRIQRNLERLSGLKPGDVLTNIQEEIFKEVADRNFELGIRKKDVHVGEYNPPPYQDLGKLMGLFDQRLGEMMQDERFRTDYEYARRVASLAHVFEILIHPLEQANSQSASNLVSALLSEGSHVKKYWRWSLDGEDFYLLSEFLSSDKGDTEPRLEFRKHSDPALQRLAQRADYMSSFLKVAMDDGGGWNEIKTFIDTGKPPEGFQKRYQMTIEQGLPNRLDYDYIVEAVMDTDDYLKKTLSEEPY